MLRILLAIALFCAGCVCLQRASADGLSAPIAIAPIGKSGAAVSFPPVSSGGVTPVAFDKLAYNFQSGSTVNFTFTFTPVGTPTAVCVWVVDYPGNTLPVGVTYGGTSMTLEVSQNTPGTIAPVILYCLANPPSGAQSIVVNINGVTSTLSVYTMSVTNSNTTTAVRSGSPSATNVNSGTSVSQNITSATNDLVADLAFSYNAETWTPGGSQTSRSSNSDSNGASAGSTAAGAGATTTMSWTFTAAPVTQVAASFQHQ